MHVRKLLDIFYEGVAVLLSAGQTREDQHCDTGVTTETLETNSLF
jgi:hypothetical protein